VVLIGADVPAAAEVRPSEPSRHQSDGELELSRMAFVGLPVLLARFRVSSIA